MTLAEHLAEVRHRFLVSAITVSLLGVVAFIIYPQILHLFAYRPAMTAHLTHFTREVMRGESPLSEGFRELIAAYTSAGNHCLF